MRVYLDTNILLDILMESRVSHTDSSTILRMAEKDCIEAILSTQSIIDAAYVFYAQGKAPLVLFKDAVKLILSHVNVTQINENDIKSAIRSSNKDFEDAAQIACALSAGCDAIISSDKKMKGASSIPVFSAREFCSLVFD